MIVIVWHLLHDNTNYAELGADYFDKRNDTDARQRHLVRELETLGNNVTLEPAAGTGKLERCAVRVVRPHGTAQQN